jgi:ABC-type lipoprotein release transport system permease subunit
MFGVSPTEPRLYIGAAGALVTIALVAAWLPARRAARVDPTRALR